MLLCLLTHTHTHLFTTAPETLSRSGGVPPSFPAMHDPRHDPYKNEFCRVSSCALKRDFETHIGQRTHLKIFDIHLYTYIYSRSPHQWPNTISSTLASELCLRNSQRSSESSNGACRTILMNWDPSFLNATLRTSRYGNLSCSLALWKRLGVWIPLKANWLSSYVLRFKFPSTG